MSQLFTDTHAVIWFLFSNPQLSRAAAAALNAAAAAGTLVWAPSICLVEITYLLERNRIPADAAIRVRDILNDPLSLFDIAPLDRLVADALPSVPRPLSPICRIESLPLPPSH